MERFAALDVDANGVLTLDELYPIIEELTGEHPVAITFDHCQQLMEIVDKDKNGTVSKDEFKEFIQFTCLVKWLEGLADAKWEEEVSGQEELRVHQLLDMIEADAEAVKKNFKRASLCPDMPGWMQEQLHSEEFVASCNEKYDALDVDGSGTLTADELFPVILEMSSAHPTSVTMDHCKRLIKIFDQEKTGVLSRKDFVDAVKFIWLQMWLEEQRLKQMIELDSLEAEWRITNLLDMWHHNMVGLKGRWGTVCNSPDVPPWLKETLQDSSMHEVCQKQFDELDVDKNGVLSADELIPVITELCHEQPVNVTLDHCQQLLEIFDEDKNGTIERDEFLEFVRFIVVVTWLQEQATNVAPPATPSIDMEGSIAESDPFVEDRTDPLQSLQKPTTLGASREISPGKDASPGAKVFEGELKATQEALTATQQQLLAVQIQLQTTTGQVAQALQSGATAPLSGDERSQWKRREEQLLQELAAAQQLAEMQKKGMAETVGKLMTEKLELESQLLMAKVGK